MAYYTVELIPDDNDTLRVRSPMLQGLNTYGETRALALKWALQAVLTWLGSSMHHDEDIPAPLAFAPPGAEVVELPPLVALKVALQRAMKDRGVTRAELARRLGQHREQVDRLFRINHRSRLDQITAALNALDYVFEPVAVRAEDREAALRPAAA